RPSRRVRLLWRGSSDMAAHGSAVPPPREGPDACLSGGKSRLSAPAVAGISRPPEERPRAIACGAASCFCSFCSASAPSGRDSFSLASSPGARRRKLCTALGLSLLVLYLSSFVIFVLHLSQSAYFGV